MIAANDTMNVTARNARPNRNVDFSAYLFSPRRAMNAPLAVAGTWNSTNEAMPTVREPGVGNPKTLPLSGGPKTVIITQPAISPAIAHQLHTATLVVSPVSSARSRNGSPHSVHRFTERP